MTLTKEKLKWIIRRISYINHMIKTNVHEGFISIGKRKEKIIIDNDTKIVVSIIDQVIENEQEPWLKTFYSKLKKGQKDISIITASPVERTKYYLVKEKFINKIYQCCIFKGIVPYEDILNDKIG